MDIKPILTLKNIGKRFDDNGGDLMALENINVEIGNGELFVFLGPSGSGKSTLLRIMSGLEKDYSGQVIFGESIKPEDMSFVFQQFALLPWLTVYENIELGLLPRGLSEKEKQEKINQEIKIFGLDNFGDNYPRDLSGGMRQRVGLARAMVTNPKVIFMDEPFSSLDSFTASELRKELLRIWHEKNRPTIILVTHLIPEALELGDRIAVLTPRPGRIEKVVENPLPRPRNHRSADFFDLEDKLYRIVRP